MTQMPSNRWRSDDAGILATLQTAAFDDLRIVYDSSNLVFLARLSHPDHGEGLGIYKPARGERPLGDFTYGTLHHREVAAFELSRLLGWDLVPPTVERDGPHGDGSLQLFIEHDPEEHYFVLREDGALHEQLVRLAVFDLVANNADRKGGHLLKEVVPADGGWDGPARLWGIDNGLTFHSQEKLRTVVWDFAGSEVPASLLDDLSRAAAAVRARSAEASALLSRLRGAEPGALLERIEHLLEAPRLPEMYPWRCTPWPLI